MAHNCFTESNHKVYPLEDTYILDFSETIYGPIFIKLFYIIIKVYQACRFIEVAAQFVLKAKVWFHADPGDVNKP